jgi:hypothetical protein
MMHCVNEWPIHNHTKYLPELFLTVLNVILATIHSYS